MRHGQTVTRIGVAILAGLALVCSSMTAESVTIYDDGGTYTISVPDVDIQVSNGSRVSVVSGGTVSYAGDPNPNAFAGAVTVFGRSRLKVTGHGSIDGGINHAAIFSQGDPIQITLRDDAHVSGGGFGGAAISNAAVLRTRFARLTLQDRAFVDGNIKFAGDISISDEAVVNGSVISNNAGITLNMTGGLVRGRLFFGDVVSNAGRITGGTILGGIDSATSGMELRIKGGMVEGGFRNRADPINVRINGGQIVGGILDVGFDGSSYRIAGGKLDAYEGGWLLNSVPLFDGLGSNDFHIFGGQIGHEEEGLGLFFDGDSNINFYGWDFSYTGGRLTGYLSDGNWLDVALTFGDNWVGTFNTIRQRSSVPEPGTLALLGIGLAGLGFAKRRKQT